MDTERFLPLGSVVKLTDKEEVMITGYLGFYEENNEVQVYDYIGCRLLTGYTDKDIVLFDKETIDNVIFMGYKNEIVIAELKRLDKFYEELKNIKTEKEMDERLNKGTTRIITASNPSTNYSSLTSTLTKKEGIKHD